MICENIMISDDAYEYDVFISYSHKDQNWVREYLYPALVKNNIKVIIDYRDFSPGDYIVREIENAVERSRKTILVLSPNYLESDWTEFENLLVQTIDPAAKNRRLLPLMIAPCDLPIRLRSLSYLDFSDHSNFNQEMKRLMSAIKEGGEQSKKVTNKRKSVSLLNPYVLVVDDKENWQKMLGGLLREEGFVVEVASNFSQALDTIIKSSIWSTTFDLALCIIDLNLTGFDPDNRDGIGLLAVCKLSGIPSIVVSSNVSSKSEAKLKEQFGAKAVFSKGTFSEREFIEFVHKTIL